MKPAPSAQHAHSRALHAARAGLWGLGSVVLIGSLACAPEHGSASPGVTHEPAPDHSNGSGQEEAPTTTADGQAGSTPALPPAPIPRALDFSRFDALVQQQVEERQHWQRLMLDRADLTQAQRADTFGELGRLYHTYDFYDPALEQYQRAEQIQPQNPQWPYLEGQALRSLNRLDQSVARFRHALELDPDQVPVLVRLGEVLNDLDRPEEAEAPLRRALELDPQTAAASAALAQSLVKRNVQLDEAVQLLEQALKQQPDATQLYTPLGLALRDLGRTDEALTRFEKVGEGEVSLEDPWMRQIKELAEGWRRPLLDGQQALSDGDAKRAIELSARAVAADPLFSLPRVLLGRALAAAGDLSAAREQLERAKFLGPESALVHYNAGLLAQQDGDLDRAVQAYARALEIEPDDADAAIHLGLANLRGGHGEAAEQVLRKLLDRSPENRLARVALASSQLMQARCADARKVLEQGLEIEPRDGFVAQALARILAACPDPAVRDGERALAIAQSLFQGAPTAAHEEALAMALAEVGRFDEAKKELRDALGRARAAHRQDLTQHLELQVNRLAAERTLREPWPADRPELLAGG